MVYETKKYTNKQQTKMQTYIGFQQRNIKRGKIDIKYQNTNIK